MSAHPPKELPDHVAAGEEWKAWPRKKEAHLTYGARERQITALCREGSLQVWICPDGSLRLDPSVLEEHFGAPGVFAGRDRAPADKATRARRAADRALDADEWDTADPLPGLVRELRGLVKELREEKRDVLKLVLDPANHVMAMSQKITDQALARVRELEASHVEVLQVLGELQSTKTTNELQIQQAQNAEARRGETMKILREQAAPLLGRVFGGGMDLASFVRGINPQVLEAVLESGMLDAERSELLRRAAGLAAKPKPTNGKADEHAS